MSAGNVRRGLLAGAVVCFALFASWLLWSLAGDDTPDFARWGLVGTPAWVAPDFTLGATIAQVAGYLGLMLLSQWLFLRPLRGRAGVGPAAAPRGARPGWAAMGAVAFASTLLCIGFVATVLELPDWWQRLIGADRDEGSWWPVWGAMLAVWVGWTFVFRAYFGSGDLPGRMEAVIRALIRGSCLELLIAVPTHALVYRRDADECYCVRGSYTGIVFGVTALLWAFGPGLALLFLREKRRREPILRSLCPRCGAPLPSGPGGAQPCPHCGPDST